MSERAFIFITEEGFTFQPGSGSNMPDVENFQVIGFSKGVNEEEAFRSLLQKQPFWLAASFEEVICFELKHTDWWVQSKAFSIDNYKNRLVLSVE